MKKTYRLIDSLLVEVEGLSFDKEVLEADKVVYAKYPLYDEDNPNHTNGILTTHDNEYTSIEDEHYIEYFVYSKI